MHGQSYGFAAFSKGDKIELTDIHTLLCVEKATVKQTEHIDDYEIILTLDEVRRHGRQTISLSQEMWWKHLQTENFPTTYVLRNAMT